MSSSQWLVIPAWAVGMAVMLGWELLRPRAVRGAWRLDALGPLLLLAWVFAGILFPHLGPQFTYLGLGAGLVWLATTLADGLRRPWPLLVGLLLGGGLAAWGGVLVGSLKLPFTTTFVSLGWASPAVTVLWLGVCGLLFAASAAVVELPLGVGALAGLALLGVYELAPFTVGERGALGAATLAVGAGLMLPFARYLALPGARAGAATLGFLLGGVALLGALKNTAFLVALLPLLVIGVPLFSVGYTYVADLRHGRRGVALREQRRGLPELLLAQGYRRRQVVGLLLAGNAYLCLLALLLVTLIEVSFLLKALLLVAWVLVGVAGFYVILRLLPRAAGSAPGPREVWLLGVRLHALTPPQAVARVEEFLRRDTPHMVVTSDASAVMRAQDDAELREIMNQADLVTADGAGVVLAARLLNLPLSVRVSGCDLVPELCEAAARQGRGVFFFGGEPGVAEEAARVLSERIPGLQVAGCRDGYFSEAEEPEIVAQIRQARPGLLLVALGIPKQEKWIRRHLEELGVPVCIGIGGSLDVISGRKRRAPVWMRRLGLEWLYRTLKEPRRLPRLAALPRIVWLAFRELLRR